MLLSLISESNFPPLVIGKKLYHVANYILQLSPEGAVLQGGKQGIELGKGFPMGGFELLDQLTTLSD